MTEHPTLAAALVAALADLSVVEKNRTAKIETKNGPSYSYEYADLGDVVKVTRPTLAEHGLVVLTPIEEHGNGLKCTIVLIHSSGERMDFGPFPFPHGSTAQATGSMVTYYRRYALVAALGMAAGDDDDGAQAAPRQEHQQAQQAGPTADLGDVANMHPRDVSAALRERGLPAGGTPEELRVRLAEALRQEPDADPPGEMHLPVSPGAPSPTVPSHGEVGDEVAGAEDAAPATPTAPAAVDPTYTKRIIDRLDKLPDEIRRASEDRLVELCDGRFPNELDVDVVPTVNEVVSDAELAVKPGSDLVERAARRANTGTAA